MATTLTLTELAALDHFEARFRAAIREPLRELLEAVLAEPDERHQARDAAVTR